MILRGTILLVISLLLQGCLRNSELGNKDMLIAKLVHQAEDDQQALGKRLAYASQADSLANSSNNMAIKLDAKRTVAGIHLMLGNLESAKIGFFKMLTIADNLSDFENIGIAYNNLGIIYDKYSNYDSALSFYSKAVLNFSKNNNRIQIARSMVNIGIVQLNQENYEDAFQTSVNAAKILNTLKAENELASVYITLGIILKRQTALDKAMSYFEMAQLILQAEKDTSGIAILLTNMGDVYREKKRYFDALKCYRQSFAMKTALGLHQYTGSVLDNMAEVYVLLNDVDSAEKYCEEALDVWISNNDREGVFSASNRIAQLFLIKNDFADAITLATNIRSQFPQKGFLTQKLENYSILYNAYSKQKQYDSAIIYANSVIALKDSLFQISMAKNVARMESHS